MEDAAVRLFGMGRDDGTPGALSKTSSNWSSRVTSLFSRRGLDDDLWEDLEEALIGADVGAPTTFALLDRLRERVRSERITDPAQALGALREEIRDLLSSGSGGVEDPGALLDPGDGEGPLALLVVGVNGVGKTTTIAKLASLYGSAGASVVLGASDTFRAAAIDQLCVWGTRLGIRVVAHGVGADPGAVAFDTMGAARASSADVAIIDTAGRMHTRTNLMEEVKKIRRVVERSGEGPVRVLVVMDAATGQNGLAQARSFADAVGCDGVVLSKLDGTSRGGVVLSIVAEMGVPVLFVGTGEQLEDLAPFDPEVFAEALLSGSSA